MDNVFVYGSLRKGFGLHSALTSCGVDFVGTAKCYGMVMFDLGSFPGILESENSDDVIVGELYKMDDSEYALGVLDQIEGVPYLYKRNKVMVKTMHDDKSHQSWVYVYNAGRHATDQKNKISHGDYKKYKRIV